jgi:hypothetical protein
MCICKTPYKYAQQFIRLSTPSVTLSLASGIVFFIVFMCVYPLVCLFNIVYRSSL